LNAYRTDTESTKLKLPNDNIDISEVYKLDTSENLSLVSSVGLLNFIKNFDVINTNRLHGCIAGILMDKEVNFYPNSYFKNRAVYNHSIKGVYENVNWMGQS
jgi:exopolysaccharide biosynthesis predicted pyruvyltransferase EpsI